MDHKPKSSSRIPTLLLALVFMGVLFFPASAWWNHYQTERLKKKSQELLKSEKWEAAETTARKWTDRAPNNSDAWLTLAEAYRKQNKFAETANALGRLSNSDPRILKTLALRTDLLLSELHDPIKTIETCNRILKIDPKVDRARQRLIYIYSMMLLRLKMVDQIREAIRLNCEPPEAYVYLLLSDSLNFSNGPPLINSWLKNDPNNEDLQVALAIYIARSSSDQSLQMNDSKFISGGDLSLINECLKKYPHNREVLAYFIENALEKGNLDRVAELLESAPEDAEQDSRFWRFKGRYLALKNQLNPAEDSFSQALKLNPYDWRTRLGLAEILRRKGKLTEAKKMAQIGNQGKTFSKQLIQLKNPNSINRELLEKIEQYAQECGDLNVVTAIQNRLSKSR